ncbi:MAG: 6-phosphofructokinase [Oscillospiraceae bacterium]|nr:6-phosphofructokinase [Oscillospiraceae bacterium]MBR4194972.1 6-phosphofructokinase [Oscillospiraceae bacterium]
MTNKPLIGAALIGQSGGPSAVINASTYGVIKTAMESEYITTVYGANHGIKGVLDDRLFIMNEEDPKELEKMLYTPASVLGSCRYKLADPDADETDFKRILEIFRKYNIRYFFYNGGNDSMDTCNKISRFFAKNDFECRIIGVPKTIDNDLAGTDHCPGFGSAAKYIATSIMEVNRDTKVYDVGMITIVECMGRHAGWLTASAALANLKGEGPDLIYLPEVDFDMDSFINDVKRVYEDKHDVLIAVSEGIHYADGSFVSEAKTSGTDGFGHAQLGGLATRLAAIVKAATGAKVRGIELSLLQRCASHCASATDMQESFEAGKFAMESALAGESGKMVGFVCNRVGGYKCEYALFDLAQEANTEKKVPLEWITTSHNGVTREFFDYCLPLIQGDVQQPKEDGLPCFVTLKRVMAK